MANPLTLAKINKLFVAHRRKQRSSPYLVGHINRGDCYRWAYMVHKLFGAELCTLTVSKQRDLNGNKARGFTISRHAIVNMHGKYYDAQCLRGVVNWQFLPIMKISHNAEFERMSSEVFCKSWHFEDSHIKWEMEEMGIGV